MPVGLTLLPGDARAPGARALLAQSHALMQALYPPESNHYLSVEALCAPEIRFFVAMRAGQMLGCGALAVRPGYGEVKSMFVDPGARGAGIGEALLTRIEAEARANMLPVLQLETGDTLDAAHRLYLRHGFSLFGPFGAYREDPHSVFFQKWLD